jgi:uncharacterized membrane protein
VTPMTKRLAIALAVSFGINLMLGGVLVGLRAQRWMHHGAAPVGSLAPSAHHAQHRGPRFRQGGLKQAFRDRQPEFQERRQKASAARGAVRAALEREPFDRAELERSLEALRKETTESQALFHGAIVEMAAKSGLEARRELANDFEFRGRRRK